jgi:cardiolipin synthase A/B
MSAIVKALSADYVMTRWVGRGLIGAEYMSFGFMLMLALSVFLVACVDRAPQSLLDIQLSDDTRLLELLSKNPQLLTAMEENENFSDLLVEDSELLSLLLENSTSQDVLENEKGLQQLCALLNLGNAVSSYQTEMLGHLTTLVGQNPCVDVESDVLATHQILAKMSEEVFLVRDNDELTSVKKRAEIRRLMIEAMQESGDDIPQAVLGVTDNVAFFNESKALRSRVKSKAMVAAVVSEGESCEHLYGVEFQSQMDQLTESDLISGSTVRILPEAIEAYAQRMELLAQAAEFIHIYTLNIEANISGYEVVLELANRVVLDGLRVNIIYHPITQSENGSLMMMMTLNALGAQTVPYAPLNAESATNYFLQGPHKKSWITDHPDYGVQAIVGGRNIGDFYLANRLSPEEGAFNNYWRDTDVLLRGPLLRPLIKDFADTLNEQKFSLSQGFTVSSDNVSIMNVADGDALVDMRLLENEPDRLQVDANMLYEKLIGQAKRSIDVATPYFVPSESLVEALHVALGRGVKVRLLTNSQNGSDMGAPTYYASLYHWEDLIKAGAEIFMWDLPLLEENGKKVVRTMRAKTLGVDQCVLVPGSWNFDMRSWKWQNEYLFPIFDNQVAEQGVEKFNQDISVDGVVEVNQQWLDDNLSEEERKNAEFFHSYLSGFL